MNKKLGFIVAGAAAGLILSGAVSARADEKTGGDVFCSGVNACKGQSACAGNGHSCAGQNGCKGTGITKSTEKDCTAKGGKVVPDPHSGK